MTPSQVLRRRDKISASSRFYI